ncbi:MAG: CoB--CoM heterodisulfide reductase subunit B [Promethearchaeota archaeon]
MNSLKYGFFLGCIMPNRYPQIERSIRSVFEELGIELLEMQGASCCPAPGVIRGFHIPTWQALAARNISIAEELSVDIVTGCNGCFGSLRDVWCELNENPEEKRKVNEYLKQVGRQFKGSSEPKHVVQVLYQDLGIEYLKDHIKNKFKDLKVGVHYGCHIVKPSDKRPWNGEYEYPSFLDEMVEITGAKSVNYKDKYACCGAGGAVRGAIREVSADFTREKIINMREAHIDIVINCCPFCHFQLDAGQREANDIYPELIDTPLNLPVIYITQLLGLAMGINPSRLGLAKTPNIEGVPPIISIDPFLNKIKKQLI